MKPVGSDEGGAAGAPGEPRKGAGSAAVCGTCGGMGEVVGGAGSSEAAAPGIREGTGGGGRTLLGVWTAAAAARVSREAGSGGSGGVWAHSRRLTAVASRTTPGDKRDEKRWWNMLLAFIRTGGAG